MGYHSESLLELKSREINVILNLSIFIHFVQSIKVILQSFEQNLKTIKQSTHAFQCQNSYSTGLSSQNDRIDL